MSSTVPYPDKAKTGRDTRWGQATISCPDMVMS